LPTPPFWFATARMSGLVMMAPGYDTLLSSRIGHCDAVVIVSFAANRNGLFGGSGVSHAALSQSSPKPGFVDHHSLASATANTAIFCHRGAARGGWLTRCSIARFVRSVRTAGP